MKKTTATVATVKTPATVKEVAKKPEAVATPVTATPARLGKAGIAVLTALVKEGPLTRPELSLRTGIKSGFVSLLGPATNIPAEPSSLAFKGFITIGTVEGKNSSVAIITDKGRAALLAATSAIIPAATPAVIATPAAKPEAEKKPAAKKPVAKK